MVAIEVLNQIVSNSHPFFTRSALRQGLPSHCHLIPFDQALEEERDSCTTLAWKSQLLLAHAFSPSRLIGSTYHAE